MKQCRDRSPYIDQLWSTGVMSTMVVIWRLQNSMVFGDSSRSLTICQQMVRSQVVWTVSLSFNKLQFREEDKSIMRNLGLAALEIRAPIHKQVVYILPSPGQIKANTDRACQGNPGKEVFF